MMADATAEQVYLDKFMFSSSTVVVFIYHFRHHYISSATYLPLFITEIHLGTV